MDGNDWLMQAAYELTLSCHGLLPYTNDKGDPLWPLVGCFERDSSSNGAVHDVFIGRTKVATDSTEHPTFTSTIAVPPLPMLQSLVLSVYNLLPGAAHTLRPKDRVASARVRFQVGMS